VLSCSPKAITGSAEAKKIYMVGANILMIHMPTIHISFAIDMKSEIAKDIANDSV
jgi:hypothetical protein